MGLTYEKNWGGWGRTSNLPVNSRALCRLSYTPRATSRGQTAYRGAVAWVKAAGVATCVVHRGNLDPPTGEDNLMVAHSMGATSAKRPA
jgi:hypothetical protein